MVNTKGLNTFFKNNAHPDFQFHLTFGNCVSRYYIYIIIQAFDFAGGLAVAEAPEGAEDFSEA